MGKTDHKHEWLASDEPGFYTCECGGEAFWNRELQEIEIFRDIRKIDDDFALNWIEEILNQEEVGGEDIELIYRIVRDTGRVIREM